MKENLFPHVFQPLTIRGVTLKNRLQYAPTVVLKCSPEGDVTEEMIQFMTWQAKTGAALVTLGDTPIVRGNSSAWTCELNVCEDRCIHGMRNLVEAARYQGVEISAELGHAGRGTPTEPGGEPALAPSDRPYLGRSVVVQNEYDNIKEMDRADMDFIRDRFVDCAVRMKKAGFRVLMMHCGHNNLLAQFVSPDSNVRTDEYGGSLENRLRYPLEVLAAVREAVGNDMVIEARFSAQEDTPGGLEFDEALAFIQAAEPYIDIVNVSRGNVFTLAGTFSSPTYFKGRQLNVPFAAEIKKHVNIPVAVVGNITSLAEAEEIIASGKADIVAMAKSYMADGDIIHKSLEGRADEVRPCTRCDHCGNANMYGTSMHCAVNPRMGIPEPIPKVSEEDKKTVMIIGGGPAGMMAAQILIARGHHAKLYEKSDHLGGLLDDATIAPFKEYMRLYLDWHKKATQRCGAEIFLNTEVTMEMIEQENPDAIIVCTGSKYLKPKIAGIEKSHVAMVRDIEQHTVTAGDTVVVCGGGITGVECGLMLAMEGKKVTVIDQIAENDFCGGMPVFNRADLFDHLKQYHVECMGNAQIQEFTDNGVRIRTTSGEEKILTCDTAVLALGVRPDRQLADELLKKYPADVYVVGDCVGTGRNLYHANQEAYHAAMNI